MKPFKTCDGRGEYTVHSRITLDRTESPGHLGDLRKGGRLATSKVVRRVSLMICVEGTG